jgi:hypothetical protein
MPTLFSPELVQTICNEIANGKSLRELCRRPSMPDRKTIQRWLTDPEHEEFRSVYNMARMCWADSLFEEIAELAAQARQLAEDAETRGLNAHATVAALREEICAKMWVCGRLAPHRYGDRVVTEITGPNGRDLVPSAATPDRVARVFLALAERLPGSVPRLP